MAIQCLKWAVYAFCMWLSLPAFAQTGDSMRVHELAPVQVLTLRSDLLFEAGAKVIVPDSATRVLYSAVSLTDFIQQQTPAYVRNYGNGMLGSVSFRGTGSERTAVIWNGFTINYGGLGLSDMSMIQTAAFDEVAIRYGAASATQGNGAIGGAILIGNAPVFERRIRVQTQQHYGSFNTYQGGIGVTIGGKKIYSKTTFLGRYALNNFAFTDRTSIGFPVKEQQNAAYSGYSIIQDVFWRAHPRILVSAHGWIEQLSRQIPPAMGSANTQAKEFDQNIRLALKAAYHWKKLGVSRLGVGLIQDVINYEDENFDDASTIRQLVLKLDHQVFLHTKVEWKLGGDLQVFDARVEDYNGGAREVRGSLYSYLNYQPIKALKFTYAVRYQRVPGLSPPLTGMFGSDWRFLNRKGHQLLLKMNVSTHYRVPTLNDRYWVPGGNLNLLPEDGWNGELGLRWIAESTKQICFEAELTGYAGFINNWIQWVPQTAGYWMPQNVKQVILGGAELNVQIAGSWGKRGQWRGGFFYGYTRSINQSNDASDGLQLIYTPEHKAGVHGEVRWRNYYLHYRQQFTGTRYTRADHAVSLKPYQVIQLELGKTWNTSKMQINVHLQLHNLTNTSFETIELRPMPGINYLVGVRFSFSQALQKQTK